MDNLVILACGGTGREIKEIAQEKFNILGYLDDIKVGPGILGTLKDIPKFMEMAKFCSGLGSYRSMQRRQEILRQIPLEAFANVYSGDSRIYAGVKMGQGITIFPFSTVSCGVRLGDHAFIYHHCIVSHDVSIGDYSMVANSVTISGNVRIGSNCYIGARATIIEGIMIGNNTIIAAGATVVKDVGDNVIYVSKDDIKRNAYNA